MRLDEIMNLLLTIRMVLSMLYKLREPCPLIEIGRDLIVDRLDLFIQSIDHFAELSTSGTLRIFTRK